MELEELEEVGREMEQLVLDQVVYVYHPLEEVLAKEVREHHILLEMEDQVVVVEVEEESQPRVVLEILHQFRHHKETMEE